MAKRFSRYKFARRISKGAAAAGSPLAQYMQYAKGEITPTYTRSESSKPGSAVLVYLAPFGDSAAARYAVRMSERAQGKLDDLIDSTNKFYHLALGEDIAVVNEQFLPAKAIIHVSGSGTNEEESKITGLRYTKETGAASYTVPFAGAGAGTDNRVFLQVANAINTGVKAKNSEYTVSFTPEHFRGL
jgi:hypothetical protein